MSGYFRLKDLMSTCARRRRSFQPPRGESEYVTALAVEHDLVDAEPGNLQSGNGPGVGPCPGPGFLVSIQASIPGVFQQQLGENGLGVNIGAMAELQQARRHHAGGQRGFQAQRDHRRRPLAPRNTPSAINNAPENR